MKVLSITAGAGNMFCGSCLRDNNLAAELKAQGHDVLLLPLYTPTRTDENNVSSKRVFFGGISIYLQQQSRLFRRMPKFFDKLWDMPAVIKLATGRGVEVDPAQLGAMTVSMLEGLDGNQRKEIDNLTAWLRHEPAPDVVTLPYTLLIALARPLREATGRPVLCSLQGEELFLEGLIEPYRTRALALIRAQVREVDGFIAVSRYCAGFMREYLGIPESKMHTVPLGINMTRHGLERRSQNQARVVGFLGRIAEEKGLHLLAEAYRILRGKPDVGPLRLEAAGYMAPEKKKYLAAIEARMAEWGIAGEFRYWGEVDREQKVRFLQNCDVFSMPCTYDEPKGLPVIEAMANGVPVVAPRRGSFPETIEATGGGLLVEPDSAEALAEGLHHVLRDASLALRLGRAGYEGVRTHYDIAQMARRTAAVFEAVAATSSPSRQVATR